MFHQTKLFLLCLLAGFLSLGAAAARDVPISRGDIVVIPLKGEVSPSLALFIRRAEKTAESQGATAIILDMDTYGGQLESAEEITSILNHATIPTYTFINSNAGSAGSLIALATRHIYMAPVSAIGAAAPILDRSGSAADGKGENDLVLVGPHSRDIAPQRSQSRHRRSLHRQGKGSEDR